jgi:hypothetical protein
MQTTDIVMKSTMGFGAMCIVMGRFARMEEGES